MNHRIRCVAIVFATLLGACATEPKRVLSEPDKLTIREMSTLPMPEFLSRFFAKTTGPATMVKLQASFGYFNNRALFQPRLVLEEFCAQNNGRLFRQANSQVSWRDHSPEAMTNPRTSGAAGVTLRAICDPSALNPACGASNASKEGVFGVFQCRERSSDVVLWAVSVEGSPGVAVSQGSKIADMNITLAPVRAGK